MPLSSPFRLERFAAFSLLGLACGLLGVWADDRGQNLESGLGVSEKEYVVPVLEYSFEQDLKKAAPFEYRSVKASGLPLALRHRIDAIWSGASKLIPLDNTGSDFPVVAEVQYRLRRSPWSDPERLVKARLLDGTRFQGLVTREFGVGREYEMSAALQHSESALATGEFDVLSQTTIPVEVRTELSEGTDLIVGAEYKNSRLNSESDQLQSSEKAIKVGVGTELTETVYGQLTAGGRHSQIEGQDGVMAAEVDAALIWQAGADSQYSLTFNRSTRPSLEAREYVKAKTISLSGDFTLSDMWSSYYGVSKSWAELSPSFGKEIYSGEVAVSFSPSQSISFSGGYVYRSGSLNRLNSDEAEQIIRLSASLLY